VSALVYAHTVEALFHKVLAPRIGPALKLELKGLGLDLDQKAKDIPQQEWAKILACAVRHLFPTDTADQGYYRLGETLMQGYADTFMGKAVFTTLRLLGPSRAARRIASTIKSGNNYIDAKFTELAPNHFEMWASEVNGNPHYARAVMIVGLRAAGAKNVRIEAKSFDGHAATFDIAWDSGA
jgi:uncharacterized protein (TIGR02265 family)